MVRSFYIVCFFILFGRLVYAQNVDTLSSTTITDTLPSYKKNPKSDIGNRQILIDTTYQKLYILKPLDKILKEQSNIFVRSFGVNGMSSLSIRGASAAQNNVLWNGVPLSNPSFGFSDISILNSLLFSNINIEIGGNAILYGTGSMGGAILLESTSPKFSDAQKLKIHTGAGSFGYKEIGTQLSYETSKWSIQWNSYFQKTNNNFPYIYQDKTYKLSNAAALATGSLLSFSYQLNTKKRYQAHYINLQAWWQYNDREIPPAFFELKSTKLQQDNTLRNLIHWHLRHKSNEWNVKFSFIQENAVYNDTIVQLFNRYHSQSIFGNLQWKHFLNINPKWGFHRIQALIPIQYTTLQNPLANINATQVKHAIAFQYEWIHPKKWLQIQSAIRKDWVINQENIPLSPALSSALDFLNHHDNWKLQLTAAIQKTYRVPTLNELYYFPGGNAQLLPEYGWNRQTGISSTFNNKKTNTSAGVDYFNRSIHNWIYWLGGAIWTPYNISKVRSSGFEFYFKYQNKLSPSLEVLIQMSYAHTIAHTIDALLPNDKSIGKQIPYVPKQNVQNNLSLIWKKIVFNYNHTYTGYRFITIDESMYLNPFYLANIQVNYTFQLAASKIMLNAAIQNIWNNQYQVIANRPMPGRNLVFQCSIEF